jgi:hypothetical protein
LYVENWRKFLPDGLDGCVRHARKNFKRSRKFDLIHALEGEAAPESGCLVISGFDLSLTNKGTPMVTYPSWPSVGNMHSTRGSCAAILIL